MICRGDNPEGDPSCNKYLARDGDGYRGVLLAVSLDGHEAALQLGDGRLILVRELGGPNQYPTEIHDLAEVPKGWRN